MRKLDKIRNEKIRKIVGRKNTLVQLIYARQCKWLGHVFGMDDEHMKMLDSTRRRGKPKTTWMSAIEKRPVISYKRASSREKWKKLI